MGEKMLATNNFNKYIYSEIKNKLLSYRKVKSRITKTTENFKQGRILLAKVSLVGKSLRLYLALDPNDYDVKRFRHKDVSAKRKYALVPMMVKVKNESGLKRAMQLIDNLVSQKGLLPRRRFETVDYVKELADKPHTPVGERGFMHLMQESATRADAEKLPDYDAEKCVATQEIPAIDDPIRGNISLGEINDRFRSGQIVDLRELKRARLITRDINYIKVTADGTLEKPLTIKANSFAADAVKMILLTGGTPIRLKEQKPVQEEENPAEEIA